MDYEKFMESKHINALDWYAEYIITKSFEEFLKSNNKNNVEKNIFM